MYELHFTDLFISQISSFLLIFEELGEAALLYIRLLLHYMARQHCHELFRRLRSRVPSVAIEQRPAMHATSVMSMRVSSQHPLTHQPTPRVGGLLIMRYLATSMGTAL